MQTKDLKVYQDTVEFCKVLHRLARNFPRFEKYSIGGKLFNDSLDLIQLIAHANRDIAKREQWLTEYLVRFESIKSLLRICLDERILPKNSLREVTRLVLTIEKQITGWKNSAAKKSRIG